MTQVDQFESVFRAAARTLFEYEPVEVGSVLVVTDLEPEDAADFEDGVRSLLTALDCGENIRWRTIGRSDFASVPELLERVEEDRPGMICTYRHLLSESWQWPYTLGEYVDVLTQVTTTPVLVLPHPERAETQRGAADDCREVMAVTDHLTGDQRLVNWAVRFTEEGGKLFLTHVEDDVVFKRYIDTIGKISSIDTDDARARIEERLLKEPADYIASCREAVERAGVPITIEEIVVMGHRLRRYEQLIEEHEVDLLVFNTKDADQLAMHGLAYPLAVELRQIPILML